MNGPTTDAGRGDLSRTIAAITPCDPAERAHIDDVLAWIGSGADLFRLAKPATPPKHLVAYFQVIDPDTGQLLLGEHRKAGLLLPNGGHVEPGETLWDTVARECREELRIRAEPSPEFGTAPVFVSVTSTRGPGEHVDVSVWHVVHAHRTDVSYFDADEFTAMRWLTPQEILAMPTDGLDPCQHRFVRKLATAAAPGAAR
ncbi:DNA mismatch repair protein MutT [Longispora fulva]|uniref:8-oxo-dGTP pyrophosphatase MutT (NUDIX family) n=1 Tax=Longispora fulva TaxID=619741 RepID=A0A8J7KKD9_9ACTN|nr:NUDIX domain-containing protein [Longispora fulva]MBG6136581.1 8-oxo-dGTP pyrophosphatase MutT (NUDIX family) [Longispora fulva]GIG59750.1 DNA mismatch repair protein MutT [Longispora fulva]